MAAAETLKKHVLGAWGAMGQQWLDDLPKIIKALEKKWKLSNLKAIDFPSYNYVAFGMQGDQAIVLKISCDATLIAEEYQTHAHFNCKESVAIFDYDHQYQALLMDRAVPGDTLNDQPRDPITMAMTIENYAKVLLALQACDDPVKHKGYKHSREWLKVMDRISNDQFDQRLIDKAIASKNNLLQSCVAESICHGDLHGGNVILQGKRWIAIDPKGIVGDIGFEAAAYDVLSNEEMKDPDQAVVLLKNRIGLLADALHYDYMRLVQWFFVRAMMCAQWFIDDKGDPVQKIHLAQLLFVLLDA